MSTADQINPIVHLLHEMGMLSLVPRSGFALLGSGKQSVAEHSFRVALTAFALARLLDQTPHVGSNSTSDAGLEKEDKRGPVDIYKLVMMCLFHDLPEARIGDINYFQKKYVIPKLDKAIEDIAAGSCVGSEIAAWIHEYERGESLEAQLAGDADQLELLLVLKREEELGNAKAKDWMVPLLKRLQTTVGKEVAEAICRVPSDDWWIRDKSDPHWIQGGKNTHSS